MKKVIIGLFLLGLTTQIYAQNSETFPAVYVVHNYKYLSDAGSKEAPIPLEELHLKVSDFNVKELDIYTDEYDFYYVNFVIPEGKILASYDSESNLLRTVERYGNINLPISILKSITDRFPNWIVSKNLYLVNYHEHGKTRKLYKITLENGDKRIKIKIDDKGDFL